MELIIHTTTVQNPSVHLKQFIEHTVIFIWQNPNEIAPKQNRHTSVYIYIYIFIY